VTGGTARRSSGARPDVAVPAFTGRLSSLPPRADELFAYGTLQFGPVLEAVLGRLPDTEFAVARDRRVAVLPQHVYPGLVAQPGRLASGLLLRGLTPAEWTIIDAFEDEEYVVRSIQLVGREEPAPAFVWTAVVSAADWLPEEFAADHLPGYVTMCARWRAEQD
jgi:hypothetical protein